MFVFTQVLRESEDGAAYRTPNPLTADDVVRPIQQHIRKITFPIIFTEKKVYTPYKISLGTDAIRTTQSAAARLTR